MFGKTEEKKQTRGRRQKRGGREGKADHEKSAKKRGGLCPRKKFEGLPV